MLYDHWSLVYDYGIRSNETSKGMFIRLVVVSNSHFFHGGGIESQISYSTCHRLPEKEGCLIKNVNVNKNEDVKRWKSLWEVIFY